MFPELIFPRMVVVAPLEISSVFPVETVPTFRLPEDALSE